MKESQPTSADYPALNFTKPIHLPYQYWYMALSKLLPLNKERDNLPPSPSQPTNQPTTAASTTNNVHPPPPPTLPPPPPSLPAPPPPDLHHNPAPLRNLQPSPKGVPKAATKTQTRIPRHVRNPKPLYEGSMPKSIRHGPQKAKFCRTKSCTCTLE